MLTQLSFRADVTVERHARHPEFGTQLADFRFLLPHRCLSQANLRFVRPNFLPPFRPRAARLLTPPASVPELAPARIPPVLAKIPKTSLPLAVVVSMSAP